MKQTILFSILAMFIMISANSAQAQMVSFHKNGVLTQIDAQATIPTPEGNMTGLAYAKRWETAYQNSLNVNGGGGQMDLPNNSGNAGNQLQNAQSQLALENMALQNEKLRAETKAVKTTNTLNVIATGVNVVSTGFQVYNNTRMTTANIGVLNSQAQYIGNMANSMNNCCGNGNGTITPPYPAPNPNPIYTPPAGTVFYDNRDGLGPFYIAANGQRVYTVPNPGTPINYGYAGQTPTNNGNAGWTNNGGYQQQNGSPQGAINQLYYTGNMNPGY